MKNLHFPKSTLLVLFCLIQSLLATAQNEWKDGYMVNMEGDTITGFVMNKNEESNDGYCVFWSKQNIVPVKFSPDSISAYGYTKGKTYLSKRIIQDDQERKVFLEVIYTGMLSVYKYPHTINFYMEKGGDIRLLENTKVTVKQGNGYVERERNEYIGVLSILSADAPQPMTVEDVALEANSLKKFARKYQQLMCSDCEKSK